MSYRDHYDDTLHGLVHAEAEHDYRDDPPEPREGDREPDQGRPSPPSEEVAKAVREALDASGGLF